MLRVLSIIVVFLLTLSFTISPDFNEDPEGIVGLGEKLFFDPILSLDNTISCASCHKPEFAFADNVAISPGVGGAMGTRNAPSVMNMADRSIMFFDGRADNLIHQVLFPIEDPLEMNLPADEAVRRLSQHKDYQRWFRKIFNEAPTIENLSRAIAAYEESLETFDTPFDRWMKGDKNAMSESAIRGRALFVGERTKCFDCHFGPDFTGDEFRNIGLFDNDKYRDVGRFAITKDSSDLGKFKVPGLRNIAITAPYMHDGSFKTLREVIDYYDNPFNTIHRPINIDTLLTQPLNLSEQDKVDLENFLFALTDVRFLNHVLETPKN